MILAKNKKAYFDYEIKETFEAGIILEGWEVKSIKNNMFSIKESFVKVSPEGKVYLEGMHVSRWKTQSRTIEIKETRTRELLLKKKEIETLVNYRRESGISILVLTVFLQNNKIKLKIGIGRGRKKYDKREVKKKRDFKRELKSQGNVW